MPNLAETVARRWTVEDFLAWERLQEDRYEFVDGLILPTEGCTFDHLQIAANIFLAIGPRVRCEGARIFPAGMRIVAGACVLYPDIVITRGPVSSDSQAIEPQVVMHVLGRRTAAFDRGRKAVAYQVVSGIEHLFLVSQDQCRIDALRRLGSGWYEEAVIDPAASIRIEKFGALTLHEIYQGTSVAP